MDKSRLVTALRRAYKRFEQDEWVTGKLGKLNADSTYTFDVAGRPNFVHVVIRNANGAQTVVAARNDAGVEHSARMSVKMKLEYGVYVIYGRDGRADLGDNPVTPPYGIRSHAPTHQDGGTDEIATLTPAAGAIPKADANSLLDDWVSSVAEQTVAAAAKATPIDADSIPLVDSAAANVLKELTWANVKATLKTYFDTLYNLYVHPNHTGDVTSVGDGVTTIAADTVTNAKAANMAESTIKGRAAAAGTGDPTDLTATQVRTIINVEDGADVTDAVNIASSIVGVAAKATPVDADTLPLIDSAAGNALKELSWANLKATLKAYNDGLYVDLTTNQSIGGVKTFTDDPVIIKASPNLNIDATTGHPVIAFKENGTFQWQLYYNITTDRFVFAETGVADQLTIIDGGEVVISGSGTSPALTGNKLTVYGSVAKATASKNTVATFGSSDTANQMQLRVQITGSATAASRKAGIQSVEAGIATRTLDLQPDGGGVNIGDGVDPTFLYLDGAAGSSRDLAWFSGGSARWIFRVNSTAESGSNVGSDWSVMSRTDAGGILEEVLFLKRSSGFVGIKTSSPVAALHVDANATAWDASTGLAIFQDNADRQIAVGGIGLFRRDVDADWGALGFNYIGYLGGTTRFRDFTIYDGKNAIVVYVDGSAGAMFVGGLTSGGASKLGVEAGSSSNDAAVGGVLYATSTKVSNTLTGEDALVSYSIPANTLSANNQSIWFEIHGTFLSTNDKRLRIRFGTSGTNLICDTIFYAGSAGEFYARGRIIRTGAATQKGYHQLMTGDSFTEVQSNLSLNQTLSGAVTFQVSGEATLTGEISVESCVIGWDDANS